MGLENSTKDARGQKLRPDSFLTDDDYAIPTGVAIQSIVDHHPDARLDIWLACAGVGTDNKARLLSYNTRKTVVRTVDVSHGDLSCYEVKGHYVSVSVLLKFCLPELMAGYDKILHLDGDILVQDDISPLMNQNLEGCYAAAVADMSGMGYGYHTRLGRRNYFNAGVMLMNAARMREERMEDALFEIMERHPDYPSRDQDAMNDAFNDEVQYLSPRWNLMTYNLMADKFSIEQINEFFHVNYSSLAELEADAAILHLTNQYKPWKYRDAYQSEAWLEVFARTPFADLPLHLEPLPVL